MSRPKLFSERASINIYFDKEDLDRIGKIARTKGISRGEIIRNIITREIYAIDV